MNTVNIISFREYLELEDQREYDFLIKFSAYFREPLDWLKVGDIQKHKFGVIKDYQYEMGSLNINRQIEYLKMFTGLTDKELGKLALSQMTNTIAYIDDEISKLVEIESQALTPTFDEDSVDSSDLFGKLGVYLQLRDLANNDITKIDDVRNMKYSDCFVELYTRKQLAEYQRIVNKVQKERMKRK